MGADKGYDSDELRRELKKRNIKPILIRRENNQRHVSIQEIRETRYCCQRWKVERSFSWLNNNRRVDRFMEKKTSTYQGVLPFDVYQILP